LCGFQKKTPEKLKKKTNDDPYVNLKIQSEYRVLHPTPPEAQQGPHQSQDRSRRGDGVTGVA